MTKTGCTPLYVAARAHHDNVTCQLLLARATVHPATEVWLESMASGIDEACDRNVSDDETNAKSDGFQPIRHWHLQPSSTMIRSCFEGRHPTRLSATHLEDKYTLEN